MVTYAEWPLWFNIVDSLILSKTYTWKLISKDNYNSLQMVIEVLDLVTVYDCSILFISYFNLNTHSQYASGAMMGLVRLKYSKSWAKIV